MSADIPSEQFKPMRDVYMKLMIETKEETERIYELIAEGGEIFMPLSEQFFGGVFAAFGDPFSVNWILL